MTKLNVRDANTGDFIEIDLDNPSGTLYVPDYNTGEIIPVVLGGGGGKSLSDYANVVVVDSGGNGDYTTLSAALAAITDASATKRYVILIFGVTIETANIVTKDYIDIVCYGMIGGDGNFVAGSLDVSALVDTPVYTGLRFDVSTFLGVHFAGKALFVNCNLTELVFDTFTSATDVEFSNCVGLPFINADVAGVRLVFSSSTISYLVDMGSSFVLFKQGILEFNRCAIATMADNLLNIGQVGKTATVVLRDTHLLNVVPSGTANCIKFSGGTVSLKIFGGSVVSNVSSASVGLECGNGTGLSLYGRGVHFEASQANKAVNASGALTDVPLYHCSFKGGTTNITCHAGTANGTCVSF
jgi:hypothetical protein